MARGVVFNTTDAPLVVSDEGKSVGGGEWAAVDLDASQVKRALDRGELVEVDRPNDDANIDPLAASAFKELPPVKEKTVDKKTEEKSHKLKSDENPAKTTE